MSKAGADSSHDLQVRLRGKVAQRFKRVHDALAESDNLDYLKLGTLSASALARIAICEWLARAEKDLALSGEQS